MISDRLGVITFFGILVPGAYLAGVLVMTVASSIELCGLGGHERIVKVLSQETALFGGVFLFVAYLLGVLVRLFAPEYVDLFSRLYLVHVRRSKKEFVRDVFPYERTITARLKNDGMGRIPELMYRLNPAYAHTGNTPFFNYCKLFIHANDAALSRQVEEAEALVRFLSGTTLVLLIAFPLALFFIFAFAVQRAGLISALYAGLLATDVISLVLILERFKYQRRREVIMVWGCVYLILSGGSPGSVRAEMNTLGERVFFTSSAGQGGFQQTTPPYSEPVARCPQG
jgi:hypothetical protein